MKNLFCLEFFKLRHKKIWTLPFALIIVQFLWSMKAMISYTTLHGLEGMWKYMLYQMSFLNCLMMPIIISIIASRISDMEHKGCTFKFINTIISPGKLYSAKFLSGSTYLIFMVLAQTVVMIFMSFMMKFKDVLPVHHILIFFIVTVIVNLCIFTIQLGISILVSNQMIALITGLIESFTGLFAMFFPKVIQRFFLWSYYSILSTLNPITDLKTKSFNVEYTSLDLWGLFVICISSVILFLAGKFIFERKEV